MCAKVGKSLKCKSSHSAPENVDRGVAAVGSSMVPGSRAGRRLVVSPWLFKWTIMLASLAVFFFSVAFLLPPCFCRLEYLFCLSTCSDFLKEEVHHSTGKYRFIISNGSYTNNNNKKKVCLVVLCVCVCVCICLIWRWEKNNIYEKHLYDEIPLECEARQC